MPINRRTWPSRPATILFVALVLGAPPVPGGPQLGLGARLAVAQQSTRMPSPVLLKRLGEAVDGHRTGRPVYVVASYDFPHPVTGVFERQRDARTQADSAGRSFDVFGPYQTVRDPGEFAAFIMRCVHDGRTSMYGPPYCPNRIIVPLADVESIMLSVRVRDSTISVALPRETDAVFFTLAAIDKFVVPYYTRIVGVDSAAEMRQNIVRRLSPP
jgi:hypothetical protein